MRNIKRTHPGYNQKAFLYSRKVLSDETLQNTRKPRVFYTKDETDFQVIIGEEGSLRRCIKTGTISTYDLNPSEIKVQDKVVIGDTSYQVQSITYEETDKQKRYLKNPECKMLIQLVG